MALSPFKRVNVNLTISVPAVLNNSVHNTAVATADTIPGSLPYKWYNNVDDWTTDFTSGSAPESFSWGVAYYATNPNGNLLAVHTTLPTTDTETNVSTAILAALTAIKYESSDVWPNSFYTVSITNGDEIFYSDQQVVAELENFESSGVELFFMSQTYSPTLFTDVATFAPAAYLQSTQLARLGVGLWGVPQITGQNPIPKVCAGVAAFFSLIDINQGAQSDINGQTLSDVTPLAAGATDTFGDVFTENKITNLVNSQVNMYFRFANQTQCAWGLCMSPLNIPIFYYYIRQLLVVSLQNALNPLFFPENSSQKTLTYTPAGVQIGHNVIDIVLKEFVAAALMDAGYTIIDPVLDLSTPIPRSVTYTIMGDFQGIIYAIDIGGNLQG
jgi:hypothetical protein